jgi:hypothetical protein
MYGFYQSTYDASLTTRALNSPIFMLIVQLFDLLMLNLMVIPHTTQWQPWQQISIHSHQGLEMSVTICPSHYLVLSCGIILIIYAQTCHNHPETTAKTSTSYLYSLMDYDYQKQVQPSYIL